MMKLTVDSKSIRKKMIDLDINTITDLAKKSGVSKPKIHQYLNGKTPLSTTFIRLCDYLDLDPDSIVIREEISNDNED